MWTTVVKNLKKITGNPRDVMTMIIYCLWIRCRIHFMLLNPVNGKYHYTHCQFNLFSDMGAIKVKIIIRPIIISIVA
jgi:hypothetical protein